MNRTTRTLIVLVVALAMAGFASFGVYRAVERTPRAGAAATVPVVIAARELRAGTLLTADQVKVVHWPAATSIPTAFTKAEDVVDRGLIADIAEHEPITAGKLAAVGAGAGLPPSIPSGMRAISVKVNEVIGVAGFVVPGTRVDVLVTVSGNGQNRESMSRVVVSNLQVLTAGTRFDQEQARTDGKPIPTTVVTLLASPDDAERVALAATEGKVMLALRNPLDTDPSATNGIRMAGLLGGGSEPPRTEAPARAVRRAPKPAPVAAPAPPPPPPPPPPPDYKVEVIRGAKRSEESVK